MSKCLNRINKQKSTKKKKISKSQKYKINKIHAERISKISKFKSIYNFFFSFKSIIYNLITSQKQKKNAKIQNIIVI